MSDFHSQEQKMVNISASAGWITLQLLTQYSWQVGLLMVQALRGDVKDFWRYSTFSDGRKSAIFARFSYVFTAFLVAGSVQNVLRFTGNMQEKVLCDAVLTNFHWYYCRQCQNGPNLKYFQARVDLCRFCWNILKASCSNSNAIAVTASVWRNRRSPSVYPSSYCIEWQSPM